ncbi:uncharacterized protein CTRU02_208153 [Colletotrichum truncatum]|uniref:Uncharacterized protein n=1 Tax=Colletotrichum truncatum TaxID=5467 RepID=A0ACC3YVI4_COLTU|nr:uncharacterized protein CTRU02_07667 [Colletotrichum truncatum]KAF6791327.1 hypothetical protein CTRU02_07667 [Colletotrichum truncatum]
MNYNDQWVPGNLTWDQLNFHSNCTAWGQWLGALVQPDPWQPSQTRGNSLELSAALFFYSVPKHSLQADQLSTLYVEIASWFTYNMAHTPVPAGEAFPDYWLFSPNFTSLVINDPKQKCAAEYCKAAGYTGSQDLSGIGVVVSYFLEALLGTMYLIAFTIHQTILYFKKNKPKKSRPQQAQTVSDRILDSFRGSLDMFLGGAMLIAVAMLGAALYSSITQGEEKRKTNPDLPSGEAVYEMPLSLIASNFSVFPVMLLYALVKHEGHRKWLHRSVLLILWGLSASVVFLAPRAEIDYDERKSGRRNFDCDQRGSQYWQVVKATQFLVIALPLLWLVITLFLTTGFKIPGMVDKPWVKTWRGIWRLLIAWINLFLMWGILAYFAHFRQKIIDTAGGLDKNDEWTFGQVLALAAWVPVVAELFYILAFGLEDSLSGHMPSDYHASNVKNTAQAYTTIGAPLLQTDSTHTQNVNQSSAYNMESMYDLKIIPTTTSSAVVTTPPETSSNLAWNDPSYLPFQQQQPHVQRHQSWDPYYHTGW